MSLARPISGGTLLVTRDGSTAVATDPDRDRVWIVDLPGRRVQSVALERDDEPGRGVEGADGEVHVVLRGGGAVVTLDVGDAAVIERRPVCAAPRGIAFDEAADAIHVACLGGELVTMPVAGGEPLRELHLEPDLRDVSVTGGGLAVSRFRSAELLVVDAGGEVVRRRAPDVFQATVQAGPFTDVVGFSPDVAWRTVVMPGGGLAMVHQRAQDTAIPLGTGGEYIQSLAPGEQDGCAAGIVHSAVTLFDAEGEVHQGAGLVLSEATVPVDIAASKAGDTLAVVAAGSHTVTELWVDEYAGETSAGACTGAVRSRRHLSGTPVAAAYGKDGVLIVQVQSPPALVLLSEAGEETIRLPGESLETTGSSLFHAAAQGSHGLACASCHPEAGEDGRTWLFSFLGARRTQHLRGGIADTAPFHWSGDLPDMGQLVGEVLVRRMGADAPAPHELALFQGWLDAQPSLPVSPPRDAAAAARGKGLFESAAVGCAGCHGGPQLTDNLSWDVGTGAKFQTPRLVDLSHHGPWMHDGCAETLEDRFDPGCGGAEHGDVSGLSAGQIDDLVAYLETL